MGPCRGLWLWFYPTLLRCSFIHSLVRLGLHVYFEVCGCFLVPVVSRTPVGLTLQFWDQSSFSTMLGIFG
jgi:hypothetical protein